MFGSRGQKPTFSKIHPCLQNTIIERERKRERALESIRKLIESIRKLIESIRKLISHVSYFISHTSLMFHISYLISIFVHIICVKLVVRAYQEVKHLETYKVNVKGI